MKRTLMAGAAVLAPVLGWTLPAFFQEAPAGAQAESQEADAQEDQQAQWDKQFEEMLSGSRLVGFFTDSNLPEGAPLSKDSYSIHKVTKMGGDTWRFDVSIEYGEQDVTLPLALEVKWAEDTPVITLTDFPIFGLGTFTARVLFYRDQYAGTWSGAGHWGQMFGRVVREEEGAAEDTAGSSDDDG